jgi:hypothetical protein
MLLLTLAARARADCTVPARTGCQSRTASATNNCLNLSACYFTNLTAGEGNGGAVSLSNTVSKFECIDTIFCNCQGFHGGACYVNSSLIAISTCCALRCKGSQNGQFLYADIDSDDSPAGMFNAISCYQCAPADVDNELGGILLARTKKVEFGSMNFTECHSKLAGSGIRTPNNLQIGWNGSYFNILSCYGYTAIDGAHWDWKTLNGNPWLINLDHCNFYNNSIYVLRGTNVGMNVRYCLFVRCPLPFLLETPTNDDGYKFRVADCVFSDTLPSSVNITEQVDIGFGNWVGGPNIVTAFPVSHTPLSKALV